MVGSGFPDEPSRHGPGPLPGGDRRPGSTVRPDELERSSRPGSADRTGWRCRRDRARAAIAFMIIEAYTRNVAVMLRKAQCVQRSLTALPVGFVPLPMLFLTGGVN